MQICRWKTSGMHREKYQSPYLKNKNLKTMKKCRFDESLKWCSKIVDFYSNKRASELIIWILSGKYKINRIESIFKQKKIEIDFC